MESVNAYLFYFQYKIVKIMSYERWRRLAGVAHLFKQASQLLRYKIDFGMGGSQPSHSLLYNLAHNVDHSFYNFIYNGLIA